MTFHSEENRGQLAPDVMARVKLPSPVPDLAAFCDIMSRGARAEGKEAFLKQEEGWLVIRKVEPRRRLL
jgi:hypothetical protein